jgi:hypothetical protein
MLVFPTMAVDPTNVNILPSNVVVGGISNYQIVADTFPIGLAGYDLTCSILNPNVANIVSVTYPSWANLYFTKKYVDGSYRLSGVDLNRRVQSGSGNVLLANVYIKGNSVGSTSFLITKVNMDADGGNRIVSVVKNATIVCK